ncbi:MAG: fibronectin type III domain-containing protein [Actinomycetota bacterium]|nr:fibronectin type III domain-containing protein [Actinomycetota bacterium]
MISKSPWRLLLSAALVSVLSVLGNANAASAVTYVTPTGLKATARTSSAVDLTWTAVKNAPRYRIQLATKSDMSDAVYHRVTANHREMTGLKANTKYYFKVRVITADGGNLTSYTSAVSATTNKSASSSASSMPTPGGLKSTGHTMDTVSLAWNAVTNAPRYRIQMAKNSAMSGATYFRVTPTNRVMTGLTKNTKYYFKVRVITADGVNLSPYSAAISVTTDATPPDEFTLPAPTGLASTDPASRTLSVTWNAVAGAPRYRVQLSTSSDMSAATYFRFTDTQGQLDGLDPTTKYYVKVRVIDDAGANMSLYSGAITATTLSLATPLRVASFNVKCANCNSHLPEEGTWAERRGTVVSTIMGQSPDAIGIQEAAQSWLKNSSGDSIDLSQFEDLRNRLKSAGGNYQLANVHRNNCVKSTTPTKCVAKDQGASKGTKVFFNADTVELVSQGSKRLESACSGCNERYLAWAILRQKSTGKKFFFATTHLEPTSTYYAARSIQTQQLVAEIKAKNTGKLPVIVTGDFNSTRYQTPANDPYDKMIASGLVDPLGHTYKSAKISSKATAEKRIHANYNSYNDFKRAQTFYGTNENGSNLDYIFTSPMRTTEWETVVTLDSAGKLSGTIPSDHNMIRATVLLP